MPINRQRGLVFEDGKWIWPPNPQYHNSTPRSYDPLTQIEDMMESNIHPIRIRHTTLGEFDLLFRQTGFRRVELFGDSMPLRPLHRRAGLRLCHRGRNISGRTSG
jgi:hypothetical protein